MGLLFYVSHPEVVIDPQVPVPEWSLSERGWARVAAFARHPSLDAVGTVVSSPEVKALETAELLAARRGLAVEVRAGTGEVDRSATGYVPAGRHEQLADQLFGDPTRSAEGWETAVNAQARLVAALADVLADGATDVAVVGHGGVGTLLLCRLAGWEIDRRHDQPTAGCCWTFDRATRQVVHAWRPFEECA